MSAHRGLSSWIRVELSLRSSSPNHRYPSHTSSAPPPITPRPPAEAPKPPAGRWEGVWKDGKRSGCGIDIVPRALPERALPGLGAVVFGIGERSHAGLGARFDNSCERKLLICERTIDELMEMEMRFAAGRRDWSMRGPTYPPGPASTMRMGLADRGVT